MCSQERPDEREIAALAGVQHGVVARRQLIALGFTARQIHWRMVTGRLHPVFRGVYAVGHRGLDREGRWMAAVLACGPDAVLSHRSAAALRGLRPWGSWAIDVTAAGRTRHGHPGIALHNVRALQPDDRATLDGIPVTSVDRTLLDYAELAAPHQLGWAFEAADRLDLLDLKAIDALCARSAGRRGRKRLQALVSDYRGPAPETRSELERRFLALIRDAGLPEPSVNVVVAGYTVDLYWPSSGLVVELDGYAYHRSRRSFEDDRAKDVQLQLAGCRVLRLTDRRLRARPDAVLDDVARALSAGGGAASDR